MRFRAHMKVYCNHAVCSGVGVQSLTDPAFTYLLLRHIYNKCKCYLSDNPRSCPLQNSISCMLCSALTETVDTRLEHQHLVASVMTRPQAMMWPGSSKFWTTT